MFWWLLLLSCVAKQGRTERINGDSERLTWALSSEVISHRMAAYEALIAFSTPERSLHWSRTGLMDPSQFVREQVLEGAVKRGQAEEILRAVVQRADLSDAERCIAALHLFEQTGDRTAGKWPITSTASAEGNVLCAYAAARILSIQSLLTQIWISGEVPLSLPLFTLLAQYAEMKNLDGIEQGMEWMEEEAQAFLWTILALQEDTSNTTSLKMIVNSPVEACMDSVDLIWQTSPSVAGEKILRAIAKRNDMCGISGQMALVARNEARVGTVKKHLEGTDKDHLFLALLALETVQFSSPKERQQYERKVLQRMEKTEEPTVLAATSSCLGAIGGRGSHRSLQKQLQKKIDDWVRIEIEQALMHIEWRSRNE